MSVRMSLRMSVRLSVRMSVRMSLRMSVRLSVRSFSLFLSLTDVFRNAQTYSLWQYARHALNTNYCQSAVKTERERVMVGLTITYFCHLFHLIFTNTGFSHAVFDAYIYIFLRIVVMVRNMKWIQNLFGILNVKNPWGCRYTQTVLSVCLWCIQLA
jgi:hypothetical protein